MTNENIVQMIQAGQGDRKQLMQTLYDQNRGAIWQAVKVYQGRGQDTDDLMQNGYLALEEAVRRYDPAKGAAFTTYFTYWLRSVVGRADSDIPEYLRQQMIAYSQAVEEYRRQIGLDPSDAYIRLRLKISQGQLDQLRNIMHRRALFSLDAAMPGTEDLTIADTVPDPTDQIESLCDQIDDERAARILWAAVDSLDDRQAAALRIRYQDNRTLQQTADQMQLTKDQTYRAISNGCRRLRNNKKVKQIGADRGYQYKTQELYGGGLCQFLSEWESMVEKAALRHLEPSAYT